MFGVIFNPLSIANFLELSLQKERFDPSHIVAHDDRFYHLDAHSDIKAKSPSELENSLDELLDQFRSYISSATHIVLTFGSAWGYRYSATSEIIANCHRQDPSCFTKELIQPEAISNVFSPLFECLKDKTIILTVSPVRHLRDTLELNSVSKSSLRLACHRLSSSFEHVHYFPSYEIVLDELRDYRFFSEDMLHVSPTAVGYIWDNFADVWLSSSANQLVMSWKKVRQSLLHKPRNFGSESHRVFLARLSAKIRKFPFDTSAEIKKIDDLLASMPPV